MTVVDLPRPRTEPGADLSMLAGTWINTNPLTRGMASLSMRIDGELLRIRITGTGEKGPVDWGEAAVAVYHERNDEGMEQPFLAAYELGTTRITLQGFLRQGVLVILAFTRFDDDTPRASYFSKEFFHRVRS